MSDKIYFIILLVTSIAAILLVSIIAIYFIKKINPKIIGLLFLMVDIFIFFILKSAIIELYVKVFN